MKKSFVRALGVLAAFVVALAPLTARAACSTASTAGAWAYTYTGTIFTLNGPIPAAAVGRFKADAYGNFTGSQTRSLPGSSAVETIVGNLSVNPNCTGIVNVSVYQGVQLLRTAVLAIVYDDNVKHARAIFESLTANGTNVPMVITLDSTRQFPED